MTVNTQDPQINTITHTPINYTIKSVSRELIGVMDENQIPDILTNLGCDTLEKRDELYEVAGILFDKYDNPIAQMIMKYLDNHLGDAEHTVRRTGFAEEVRNKYGDRCQITGRRGKRCQAAHILGHAECQTNHERYDPNNGILLDAGLHLCWDDEENTIIAEPDELTNTVIFRANPRLSEMDIQEQIPELLIPKTISISCARIMRYFVARYQLYTRKMSITTE